MSDDQQPTAPEAPVETPTPAPSRYADLDLLQQEVERRIRDNQRFLEHFLDEDFPEEEGEDDAGEDEDFEEL